MCEKIKKKRTRDLDTSSTKNNEVQAELNENKNEFNSPKASSGIAGLSFFSQVKLILFTKFIMLI